MRRSLIWLLAVLGFAWLPVIPSVASVDDTLEQIEDAASEPLRTDVPTLAERRFPPIRIRLDEEIEWGKFSGTDVTTFRSRLRAEVILPFTPRLVTALSVSGAIRVTEFSGGGGDFVESGRNGDPWDNLNEFFIRYRGIYQISENWGVMAAAWTSSRFEDGVAVWKEYTQFNIMLDGKLLCFCYDESDIARVIDCQENAARYAGMAHRLD